MTPSKFAILFIFLAGSFSSCKKATSEKSPFVFEHLVRQPLMKSKGKSPTLVLLHGLGSNEKDLFSMAEEMDGRLLVVSPRAPIVLSEEKFSWFDLQVKEGKFHYVSEEIDAHRKLVLQFLDEIVEQYDADPSQIYIGGFSQGAIMSLYVGMTAPDKVAGVISLSGQMYSKFKEQVKLGSDFNNLKILILHGKNDQVLPFDDMMKSALYLKTQGAQIETKWYDAAHAVSPSMRAEMAYWISNQIDGK